MMRGNARMIMIIINIMKYLKNNGNGYDTWSQVRAHNCMSTKDRKKIVIALVFIHIRIYSDCTCPLM